jgi:hypothetical protein
VKVEKGLEKDLFWGNLLKRRWMRGGLILFAGLGRGGLHAPMIGDSGHYRLDNNAP